MCGNLKVRHQCKKTKRRVNLIARHVGETVLHHARGKTAEKRRGYVIGVPFKLRGKREKGGLAKFCPVRGVARQKPRNDHCRRGAKPPRNGNVRLDVEAEVAEGDAEAAKYLFVGHHRKVVFIFVGIVTAVYHKAVLILPKAEGCV